MYCCKLICGCVVADIDECSIGADNCGVTAQCVNTLGSFDCVCRAGYEQDGRNCRGIYSSLNMQCNGLQGILVCTYNEEQYYVQHCQLYTFLLSVRSADINECSRGTDNCNANANCINTQGSFQCVCRDGYEGDGIICRGMTLSMNCIHKHAIYST